MASAVEAANLPEYRAWRPSALDSAGLGCADRQDWLVAPVARNRDSGCLDRSNFEVTERELAKIDPSGGAEEPDYEIHRFGHWANGWFEIILVRPGTPAHVWAAEAACALADYPVLSDAHYSSLESEERFEYWQRASLRERIALCRKAGASIFAARRTDDMPADVDQYIEVE